MGDACNHLCPERAGDISFSVDGRLRANITEFAGWRLFSIDP